ncbi:thioredoxin fold domain-containing protein [Cardiobacterium sp. AH-315-I02]|nr:thioredoxin fold domain-containing protein [Cardiobacterium sp. AH-315-I02]
MYKKSLALSILLFLLSFTAYSATPTVSIDMSIDFDDTQLEEELAYPDWFKLSLGDLRDDLSEAKAAGKKGIITYFGQKRCAYCEQFFKTSLSDVDIKNYLQTHYDLIAFDIWGIDDIIDTDGTTHTERELSIRYKANFTPSLVFYNNEGTPVFRLRGFYPPYKFRAALQYVTEEYYKKETFSEYLDRATQGEFFLLGGLTERDFFLEPPHDLAALRKNDKPTAVFFEQGNCHACDLLHSAPLSKELNIYEIEQMNVIQLNMWADTEVTTPQGIKTNAKEWARSLDVFYAPSIIFFDTEGKEIMRVDSVAHFYRLWGVLDYVNQEAYKQDIDYQDWRLLQREISD